MEVVPTNDGDEDDGVIWFRCPQCQGFLPKLSGADEDDGKPDQSDQSGQSDQVAAKSVTDGESADDMQWDSPAEMMAAQKAAAEKETAASPFLPEDEAPTTPDDDETPDDKDEMLGESQKAKSDKSAEPEEAAEPIHEYAALLAEQDVASSNPYRPWDTYEVGQCIHHLAWEDCGVVVAKEDLPGGRKIIKCYFEDAGVVRLIEQAPR